MSIVLKGRVKALEDEMSIVKDQLNKLNGEPPKVGGVPMPEPKPVKPGKKVSK